MEATESLNFKKPLPIIRSTEHTEELAIIKKAIWIYFFLLLFEGALRKWFLPGISNGLLIIRDPIVLWIYYLAYSKGIFPTNNKYLITLESLFKQ